jgi:hypothetical protein
MGRLGNQMFQIAAAESLAIENNDIAVFPITVQGAHPNHMERAYYSSSIFSRIKYVTDIKWVQKVWGESNFSYSEIEYSKNMMINGYFQSEKYFMKNSEYIKNLFKPTEWIAYKLNSYYSGFDFYKNTKDYVAVHVRRGDYVNLSHIHTNLAENQNYYESAMKKYFNKKFVFFSDDILWCKNNFGNEHIYVNSVNDVLDLYLMSKFENIIIANSSFSWWSAWLGETNNSKIIAPKYWFANNTNIVDLIPSRWEII